MPQIFVWFFWLIVILAAIGIGWWIIKQITPSLPPPMQMIVMVGAGLLVLFLLIWFATTVVGPPHPIGKMAQAPPFGPAAHAQLLARANYLRPAWATPLADVPLRSP